MHLNWLLVSASTWQRQDDSKYILDEPQPDPFANPNGLDPNRTLLSTDEEDLNDDENDDEALSLPSAGVANIRGESAISEGEDNGEDESEEGGDVDIGEFDWGDADKEVNDFLAELGEDAIYTTDESDNERLLLALKIKLTSVLSRNRRNGNGKEKEENLLGNRLMERIRRVKALRITRIQKICGLD